MMKERLTGEEVSELLRVDLRFFHNEEKISISLFEYRLEKFDGLECVWSELVKKGYFEETTVGAMKDRPNPVRVLCKVMTYDEVEDVLVSRGLLAETKGTRSFRNTIDGAGREEDNSDSDMSMDLDYKKRASRWSTFEFVEKGNPQTGKMSSMILELEFAADKSSCNLKYYYTLETTREQKDGIVALKKRQVKECVAIANKAAILRYIEVHKRLPEKVELEAFDPIENCIDEELAIPVMTPVPSHRRKDSDYYGGTLNLELMQGFGKERFGLSEKKGGFSESLVFNVVKRLDCVFSEIITPADNPKFGIFYTVQQEFRASHVGEITFLDKLGGKDEFVFLLNHIILVRVNCVVVQKRSTVDAKSSFTETLTGSMSVPERPLEGRRTSGQTNPVVGLEKKDSNKDKIVKKKIVLSFYCTEELPGEFEGVFAQIQTLVERCVNENFSKYIRKMTAMRMGSEIARIFVNEAVREFRFSFPFIGDKLSFLLMLKGNLHTLMSKVIGSAQTRELDEALQNQLSTQGAYQFDLGRKESANNLQEEKVENSIVQTLLKAPVVYNVSLNPSDNYFFFNYNDTNAALFGNVLFFLKILESKVEHRFYSEFEGVDGLYFCLVRQSEVGGLEFASFDCTEKKLTPKLQCINDVKLIKYIRSSENRPDRGSDMMTFTVNCRGALRDTGLVDFLEQSIKNSYLELRIDQWLHTLYLPPREDLIVETTELFIRKALQKMLLLKVEPPSVQRASVPHKIHSLSYFKEFVPNILKTVSRELGSYFKMKDVIEVVYVELCPNEDEKQWRSGDEFAQYLDEQLDSELGRIISEEGRTESSPPSSDEEEERGGGVTSRTERTGKSEKNKQNFSESLQDIKNKLGNELKIADDKDSVSASIGSHSRASPRHPSAPGKGQKKFNHYSFDINKAQITEPVTFLAITRLKQLGMQDQIMLEQLNKVTQSTLDQKSGMSESGEERKFMVPARRFMVSIEVTSNTVSILTYNLKDDVRIKLFERVADEVTFHEMRETLLYGLCCAEVMKKVSQGQAASEFDSRLFDRIELTREILSTKRTADKELELKKFKGDRFSDRDTRGGAKGTEMMSSTLTEKVFEMFQKSSNADLPEHMQIRISKRIEVKHLMDSIYTTIKVANEKMQLEALDFTLTTPPKPIGEGWNLGPLCPSLSDQDSNTDPLIQSPIQGQSKPAPTLTIPELAEEDLHQGHHHHPPQPSLVHAMTQPSLPPYNPISLGLTADLGIEKTGKVIKRKNSLGVVSVQGDSQNSEKNRSCALGNQNIVAASSRSVSKKKAELSIRKLRSNVVISTPVDKDEGSCFDFQLSRVETHRYKEGDPDSPVDVKKKVPLRFQKPVSHDNSVAKAVEISIVNLKNLSENYKLHLFDQSVKKLFDYEGESCLAYFDELKSNCRKL
jgi:hypothetical protein